MNERKKERKKERKLTSNKIILLQLVKYNLQLNQQTDHSYSSCSFGKTLVFGKAVVFA